MHAHVQSLRTTLENVGLTPPDAATLAWQTLSTLEAEANRDHYAEALAQAQELTPQTAAERVHQLATALSTQAHASAAAQALEGPVAAAYVQAIRDNVDDLIAQMRPAFDSAASALASACSLIPDGTGAADLIVLGDQAVAAHRQAENARGTLGLINSARVALARLSGEGDTPRISWYIAAPDFGTEEMQQAAAVWRGLRWEALVRRGLTLRLNTVEEARAVEQSATTVDHATAEAQRQRRIRANRDPLHDRAYARALGGQAAQ